MEGLVSRLLVSDGVLDVVVPRIVGCQTKLAGEVGVRIDGASGSVQAVQPSTVTDNSPPT